jgi:hypothetical protein
MSIYVYERRILHEVVRWSRFGLQRARLAATAGLCVRHAKGIPGQLVLFPFDAFVRGVSHAAGEGAGYDFSLKPKNAAAALRLSQNRPRPAPISILSALP